MIVNIENLNAVNRQHYLQHAIAPRPVCFASTINLQGEVNLSPFSFFNLFSIDPAIVIFSPSRRVRNNTTKHTLENVMEIPELVINIVDYDMVHQVSLASCEYPKGINEFIKSGFTEEPATIVRPPMVLESKIKLECRVVEIKELGTKGGAGNLVICEVLRMHISDELLNDRQQIDQRKIHHVARLGGDWYCRVDESNLFLVEKPNTALGIGIDALPDSIRNSRILSGSDLAKLGNVHELPGIDPAFEDDQLTKIYQYYAINPEDLERELHSYAKLLLNNGNFSAAWQVLLALL